MMSTNRREVVEECHSFDEASLASSSSYCFGPSSFRDVDGDGSYHRHHGRVERDWQS
jgi:hypothetical protein